LLKPLFLCHLAIFFSNSA